MRCIYLEGICGSRSYGLEIQGSDTDFFQVLYGIACETSFKVNSNHFIQAPPEVFVENVTNDGKFVHFVQWLFPFRFLSANPITLFINQNREAIIQAQLPLIFEEFSRHAAILGRWAPNFYRSVPKRMAYCILFRSILANYAEGMTFAQAHRPMGELHDFLIAVRLGDVSLEEAIYRNELERNRMEKVRGFYKKPSDLSVLRELREIFQKEAGHEP